MNTVINVKTQGKQARETATKILSIINEYENRTSMYLPDSDISKINSNSGKEYVRVQKDTYRLLKRAYDLCEESGGRFDITVGPLVTLWNINTGNPQIPQINNEILSLISYKDIAFDESINGVKLNKKGQQIDLGGIAKGDVCDKIYEVIKASDINEAIVSLGGNVIVYGNRQYNVGIQHPRNPDSIIATVSLQNKLISTAGDYQRFFEADGIRYHHIIDPSSGMPYNSDFYSVTIIGEDGALCDYLSTLMFMTPKDRLIDLLDDYSIIAFGKDNKVYASKNLDISLKDSSFTVYNN